MTFLLPREGLDAQRQVYSTLRERRAQVERTEYRCMYLTSISWVGTNTVEAMSLMRLKLPFLLLPCRGRAHGRRGPRQGPGSGRQRQEQSQGQRQGRRAWPKGQVKFKTDGGEGVFSAAVHFILSIETRSSSHPLTRPSHGRIRHPSRLVSKSAANRTLGVSSTDPTLETLEALQVIANASSIGVKSRVERGGVFRWALTYATFRLVGGSSTTSTTSTTRSNTSSSGNTWVVFSSGSLEVLTVAVAAAQASTCTRPNRVSV